jgi:PAS domain S-box-containing protein
LDPDAHKGHLWKRLTMILKQTPAFIDVAPASTEAILESISEGVFTVDRHWRITFFNRAAEAITGISREDAYGRHCSEVFRSNMCETDCALRKTLKTGKPVIGKTGYIVDDDGERTPISLSTAVLRDAAGAVVGGAETFRDLSEVEALRRELAGRYRIGDIISRSPLMDRLFRVLPAIAASPSTVLILGETGTGKELVARTIHALSPRSAAPFIALNCGALPDTLLESELFGYKAGAFTGANRDKPGRLALTNGGTLFLDEIGDISPAMQIRLLRVLEDRTYEPLGATRTAKVDARIVTATHQDLEAAMRKGTFREDLFYRINVVRVELPPLRDRREDIPLLVEYFIAHFNRLQQKSINGISAKALSLLMAHHWPGNIRELENAVERAFILCTGGQIKTAHLPEDLTAGRVPTPISADAQTLHRLIEAQSIQTALEKNNYHREATAKALGIHKTTLFRRLKRLGIPFPERDGRHRPRP